MKKRIRELWIKALRSGKYKQTRHRLKKAGKYCCLGVLCDLAAKEGIGKWKGNSFITADEIQEGDCPIEVMEWAGLSYGFLIGKESNAATPIDTNDGMCENFNQIADRIERRVSRYW